MTVRHVPVMCAEVLEALQPRSGGRYIDGTLGGGGHTRALLEASAPDGRLLALDRDADAIVRARHALADFGPRVTLVQASFSQLDQTAAAYGFLDCGGVVLDLGISSDQLADAERGFSFQTNGPLDMRLDRSGGQTAAQILNQTGETELADIFFQFGEERRSRRLARSVVERRRARPFATTGDLVETVERALGGRRGRLHPATRIFQALRIAANDELNALQAGLAAAAAVLAVGGRLAVISFHSLEDRIVKQFIARHTRGDDQPPLRALNKKPLVPGLSERVANPRSRSAKLRIAERLPAAS